MLCLQVVGISGRGLIGVESGLVSRMGWSRLSMPSMSIWLIFSHHFFCLIIATPAESSCLRVAALDLVSA